MSNLSQLGIYKANVISTDLDIKQSKLTTGVEIIDRDQVTVVQDHTAQLTTLGQCGQATAWQITKLHCRHLIAFTLIFLKSILLQNMCVRIKLHLAFSVYLRF